MLALDGGGSASNHEVVAAAAAAFHGEGDHFDPVEALVAPLLLNRSRAERHMAAAVLVAHGIGEDRARAITRARGTLPLAGDGEAASPVMSFDALAAAVGPLHCVQSEVWPSHRWVRAITVSTLAVIAMVIGGLGWRAQHQRHSGRNAYLLWPKQLPKPWVLISAQATGQNPIRAQGPLVQTLSVGYSMSAQITIGDQVQQFVEPALGLTTDHSVHMVDEASFLRHTPK